MQNKAKLRKSQMNVNSGLSKDYEKKTLSERGKNKPKTNPKQTQTKPKQSQTNPIKAKTNRRSRGDPIFSPKTHANFLPWPTTSTIPILPPTNYEQRTMSNKQILITGGCGFLGQYLTSDLLSAFPDTQITILDLKANPAAFFDFSDNPRVTIHLGRDICDYDSIVAHFKNIDTVIHLAGLVSFSLLDKNPLHKINVDGTANVLNAARANKVESFIHISSVAALGYADDKNNPINETFDFDWSIAEKNKKYYMLTKHLADVEVSKYQNAGQNAVVLYPGLMFGPGDVTNSAKLIKAIKQGKIPFNMPGGTNITDVRDVSKGIVQTLKKDVTHGHYLLSGYNLTFKQINTTIAEALRAKPPRPTLPRFLNTPLFKLLLFIESRSKTKLQLPADNLDSAFKFRYFDNAKARAELDWQPEITFEQTIIDTIKWMEENGHFER